MRICDVGGFFFHNSYNTFMCHVLVVLLLLSSKKKSILYNIILPLKLWKIVLNSTNRKQKYFFLQIKVIN